MLELLLGFLLPIPQTATTYSYSGYAWAPADAPIHVESCEGSEEVLRGIARSSELEYGTSFRTTAPRTVSSVRFRFILTDDHWQPLRTIDEEIQGQFSPGVLIARTHRHGGSFHQASITPHAAALLCTPVMVRFSDGTQWSWNPPATPWSTGAAQPSGHARATPQPPALPAPRSTPLPPTVTPSPAIATPRAMMPTPSPATVPSAPVHSPAPAASKPATVDYD